MVYFCTCCARISPISQLFPPAKLISETRTNHLSAVLSELPALHRETGITYRNAIFSNALSLKAPPFIPPPNAAYPAFQATSSCSLHTTSTVQSSPLLKPLALSLHFDATIVEVLHDLGYLYAVLDAFTLRLIPMFRDMFDKLVTEIEEDWAI